jgi:hypothetical protein
MSDAEGTFSTRENTEPDPLPVWLPARVGTTSSRSTPPPAEGLPPCEALSALLSNAEMPEDLAGGPSLTTEDLRRGLTTGGGALTGERERERERDLRLPNDR